MILIFALVAILVYKHLKENDLTLARTRSINIPGFRDSSLERKVEMEKPNTKFTDVAGIDEAKEELVEIVDFLKRPEHLGRLGGRIPKGILLVGPPGVGKTLLARAVAGEAEASFEYIAGSEFVELFAGSGSRNARFLFSKARNKTPCIIFIDEIDALGKRHTALSGGESEYNQTINQVLTEMDGFKSNNGIIIMAATNRLAQLDEALLRPGRFDRIIFVNLPDIKGREQILKIHSRFPVVLDPNIDLKSIAKMTTGFSGAELANLINMAALEAAKDEKKDSITTDDIIRAKDKIKLGSENKSLSSILEEEEKRVIAYHEAGHCIVAVVMPEIDPLDKVSIIPRGQALGITTLLPEKDRYNNTKDYLEELLCMMLAGRLAEELVIGKITTGAESDLERATELARKMVCNYGMGNLGFINLVFSSENPLSEDTRREVDLAIRELLKKATEKARAILISHRHQLNMLASALLEKETLSREEIERIMKESPNP